MTDREGFGEVFPLECLKCFHEEEIEVLLCGTCERWTVPMLADTIKFDHGCALTWPVVAYSQLSTFGQSMPVTACCVSWKAAPIAELECTRDRICLACMYTFSQRQR